MEESLSDAMLMGFFFCEGEGGVPSLRMVTYHFQLDKGPDFKSRTSTYFAAVHDIKYQC